MRTLTFALAAILAALFLLRPDLASAALGRQEVSLAAGWLFQQGDVKEASAPDLPPDGWLKVTLPHTYNAGDGEDGGGYYRGVAWYRRELVLPRIDAGRRYVLQFDGAALAADVRVNGRAVGRHEGGYARFRFDVTDALQAGRNVIAVRVDNTNAPHIAPLGGDFTVFGGLYRGVSLLVAPAVHLDLLNHGGPGLTVRATEIAADRAQVEVSAQVANRGAAAAAVRVRTTIRDAQGQAVATATTPARVAAGQVRRVLQQLRIPGPRLWRGVKDPYLYRVTTEVIGARGETDQVTAPLGLRTFRVDPERGFFLNGEPYPLRGTNLFHAGRPGKGLAVTDAEIEEDFRIMADMGATALRLVHFQHPERAYELADELGFVIWTEIPLNSRVSEEPAFEANLGQQLRELIRQNFNHPSVVFWGLGNEVYKSDETSNRILAAMQRLAKAEDPDRLTAYAHCCGADDAPHAMHTDVIGFNKYFGWYPDQKGEIGDWADRAHALLGKRAMGVSEYGAGASVLHQEDPPRQPETTGGWHPEQYQAVFHERAGRQLGDRPYLWSQFVWVAFDLASDGRNEGDRPGINDKGLVTYDRRVRKDAYYWYQANWSAKPMAYITSRRFTVRAKPTATVKVYSNSPRLRLTVNGEVVGEQAPVGGVAVWVDRQLRPGPNRIRVEGLGPGAPADEVIWTYDPGADLAAAAGGD